MAGITNTVNRYKGAGLAIGSAASGTRCPANTSSPW
jgi:hypothetical protein